MIWTVVLWLGMQGQGANPCPATPPRLCYFKGCEKMAVEIDGGCPVWTTPSEPNAAILMGPNVICKEWLPDSRSSCDAAPTQFKYFKPAEHVFEIRTKTEDHGTAKDERSHGIGGTPHCDDPEDVLESPNQCHEGSCTSMYIVPHCVRITRELWMDGKRLGIIKGLD